jgi:AraC-like DNA-binding protein
MSRICLDDRARKRIELSRDMKPQLTFTTDKLAAHERAQAWREWMRQIFFGLESDLYGDQEVDGHVTTAHAGDVVMTKLEATRHRVMRSQRLGHRGDSEYLKIVAPWQGVAVVEQFGRKVSVRPGHWAIYDTSRSYEVANPEYSQHLILMLPRQQLADRSLPLDQLMGRQVGGSLGISRLALEAMRSAYLELPNMSSVAARGTGDLLLQLVHLSLLDLAGRELGLAEQEGFLDRVRMYVEQQLRNPSLSIDHIATALHCSKRHLHKAFSAEPETLGVYILRKRIEACQRDLKSPELRHLSLTEIAFSWGFNHSAHFSRAFREHAGMSPSAFRNLWVD